MPDCLFKHGRNGWKYQRHVPKDLRPTLSLRTWIKTFGAIAYADARTRARALAVEHDRLIVGLRNLSGAERQEIAVMGWQHYQRLPEGLETGLRFVEPVTRLAIVDDEEIDSGKQALEIIDAQQTAARMRGEAARTRQTLAKLGDGKGDRLTSLVSLWQTTNKPRAPKSIDKMHLAVRYFVEAVGDMAPKNVTADHVGAFRDALEQRRGMSSRTALKHLQGLNTLFNVAASERKFGVAANPCAKITVRKSGGKLVDLDSKKPFQPAQIRLIFAKMLNESEEFQWMVRLLTYHGCRTSEAAQLRVDDVMDSFGITVLRMHDTHGRLKNRPSVREVPLHSACSDFVDYVRRRPGPRVFSWPIWKSGDAGAKFSQLCSTFMRKKLGIADKALSAHSLRHTWITLAREIEMPDAVAEAITGHTLGKGAHGRYGTVPLHKQAAWLEKIDPLA